MTTLKTFLVENISISYLDLFDLKEVLNHNFKSDNDKKLFILFNIGGLVFSNQLKNNLDEMSFSLYNLDYIKEMTIYIRKIDNKLLYSSNIIYSDTILSSPYLLQKIILNNHTYSSSIIVDSKNIESIFNNFIKTSIQSRSFIILNDSKGLLISISGDKKSNLYSKLKKTNNSEIFSMINKGTIFNYKVDLVSILPIKNKCICSFEKSKDLIINMMKNDDKLFLEDSEIIISCPLCGNKYVIKKSDLQ